MREVNEFIDAENKLGDECYENGEYEEAVRHWEVAYKLGSLEAGYHLANRYYYGEGVEKDLEKSLKYFLECANLAGTEEYIVMSQFNVGNSYFNGEGVDKDLNEAFKWYLKAADNGHPSAQFNVGLSYYKGMYLEQDFEKAFEYMKEAADNEVAMAQYVVGTMFLAGHGVKHNPDYAKYYFKKAADNGDNNALHVLRQMEIDEQRAKELEEMKSKFKNVMEVESPDDIKDIKYVTMDNISDIYGESNETMEYEEIDDDMDMEDIIDLADMGNPEAQNIAGEYFIDEENEDYDEKKAFRYFSRAAVKDHPEGLYNLGVCFVNGTGVAQDLMMGVSRITKAAELGSLRACQFMFQVYARTGDMNRAVKFMEMAIGHGDMDAAFDLAVMYEDGELGEVDFKMALKYYRICAASGDEEAIEKVKELEAKINN